MTLTRTLTLTLSLSLTRTRTRTLTSTQSYPGPHPANEFAVNKAAFLAIETLTVRSQFVSKLPYIVREATCSQLILITNLFALALAYNALTD